MGAESMSVQSGEGDAAYWGCPDAGACWTVMSGEGSEADCNSMRSHVMSDECLRWECP